ncbi:MAG: hypothetical protein JST14_05670 [Bacteroidetes bacterium]|nr:hypothetical protein [Bacteroidota bacterium]
MKTETISGICGLVVFLAMIRCIAEPLRLQHFSSDPVPLPAIEPFLYGAFVSALVFGGMVIVHIKKQYKLNIILCVLNTLILIFLKIKYQL